VVSSSTVTTTSLTISNYGTANLDNDPALEYYFTYASSKLTIYDIEDNTGSTIDLTENIVALEVADFNNDSIDEIFVALSNGTVLIIDPASLTIYDKSSEALGTISDMVIQDNTWGILNTSGYVWLFSIDPLEVIWEFNLNSSNTAKDIGIAYRDSEPFKILVQLDNGTIYAIDYEAEEVSWSQNLYNNEYKGMLTEDLNGDGIEEIIAQNYTSIWNIFTGEIYYSNNMSILDSASGDVLHVIEIPFMGGFNWINIGDIDGDNYQDIIFSSQYGRGAISTKNYELVWYSRTQLQIDDIYFSDFNLDNMTDYLVTMNNREEILLCNGYGGSYLYYNAGASLEMYMVFSDYDKDGIGEIYGMLNNGTFIMIQQTEFMEYFKGIAYLEPKIDSHKRIFESAKYGLIDSIDLTGDGYEDIVVSNETHIALYDDNAGRILWIINTNTTIIDMILGNYKSSADGNEIIYHDFENVTIIDAHGSVILRRQIADLSQGYWITQIFVEDFDGDSEGEIMVVTTGGTWLINDNELEFKVPVVGSLYAVIGDFDGNGLCDIAYKLLGYGALWVFSGNGSGLWATTLGPEYPNLYLLDIFVIDYNGDGMDDIAFTNVTGEIDIFNGKTGSLLKVIPTNIESYGISLDMDHMFRMSGGLAVKYANYGFYIFDSSGNIRLEVKDYSLAPYERIDIDGDGYYEYFAMTTGKIIGLNRSGLVYYRKFSNETFGMTIINEGNAFKKKIAVIEKGGYLETAFLGYMEAKKAYGTGEEGSPISNTEIVAYLISISLTVIIAVPTITIRRKRKKKK